MSSDSRESIEHWTTSRLLSTAARLWEKDAGRQLYEAGLTPAGLSTLQALSDTGITHQAVLARNLRITPQTLGRTLRPLIGAGYISRADHRPGQRGVGMSLTPAGRAIVACTPLPEAPLATMIGTDYVTALRSNLIELLTTLRPEPARS
ncbi:MarR family winged helix-turn-helix transcriptional regulator [Arthrobacter sp. MDT1-65]